MCFCRLSAVSQWRVYPVTAHPGECQPTQITSGRIRCSPPAPVLYNSISYYIAQILLGRRSYRVSRRHSTTSSEFGRHPRSSPAAYPASRSMSFERRRHVGPRVRRSTNECEDTLRPDERREIGSSGGYEDDEPESSLTSSTASGQPHGAARASIGPRIVNDTTGVPHCGHRDRLEAPASPSRPSRGRSSRSSRPRSS